MTKVVLILLCMTGASDPSQASICRDPAAALFDATAAYGRREFDDTLRRLDALERCSLEAKLLARARRQKALAYEARGDHLESFLAFRSALDADPTIDLPKAKHAENAVKVFACAKIAPPGALVHEAVRARLRDVLAREEWACPDFAELAPRELDLKATLEVTSTPSGLTVTIDGREAGRTPIAPLVLAAGSHAISVSGPCHGPARETVELAAGEKRALTLSAAEKLGSVRVTTEDDRGRAVAADVLANGSVAGQTPGHFTFPLCTTTLELRPPGEEPRRAAVALIEGRVVDAKVVLPSHEPLVPKWSWFAAAGVMAGAGLAVDVLPESAKNAQFDTLDLVPLFLYAGAIGLAAAGVLQ